MTERHARIFLTMMLILVVSFLTGVCFSLVTYRNNDDNSLPHCEEDEFLYPVGNDPTRFDYPGTGFACFNFEVIYND